MANYAAALTCGAQINKVDCDGTVLTGIGNVALVCGVVEYTATAQLGDPIEIKLEDGSGGYCVKYYKEASRDYIELELTFCGLTDPEVEELFGLRDVVKNAAGDVVGWKLKSDTSGGFCCPVDDECPNPGVAMHFWHIPFCGQEQVTIDGKPAFAIHAFTRLRFEASSYAVSRGKEGNQITVTARGYTNPNYDNGPGGIYPDPDGLNDVEEAEWLSDEPFPLGCGCGCSETGMNAVAKAIGN